MTVTSPDDINDAAVRFDVALARLEVALAASVNKVADLARRTGFEDGRSQALSETSAQQSEAGPDMAPVLRTELEAARAREIQLQEAVMSARAALDEAMDDIRAALGPV
jgi:hypothetical protein